MSATILTRPQPAYTRSSSSRQQQQQHASSTGPSRRSTAAGGGSSSSADPPPLYQRAGLAAQIYSLQSVHGTRAWFQTWREWWSPPADGPDIVKAYEVRPGMGVRIFFPTSYDQTSPQTLPTIFTMHGGGFCLGSARDEDEGNRGLADALHALVVGLPYTTRRAYPAAREDLVALVGAVLGDASLPMARGKAVVLWGWDAGATLALAVAQVLVAREVMRMRKKDLAVVSLAGWLDLERSLAAKMANCSSSKGEKEEEEEEDGDLRAMYEACVWSYVPYGQDLRDPLLSPAFARAGALPRHVCLVGAERDVLAHESWRLACRLVRDAGRRRGDERMAEWRVPDPESEDLRERMCGRVGGGGGAGQADELLDGVSASKRFGFEERWGGSGDESGSVKWMLVPNVSHGFGDESVRRASVEEVGKWLRETVWKDD